MLWIVAMWDSAELFYLERISYDWWLTHGDKHTVLWLCWLHNRKGIRPVWSTATRITISKSEKESKSRKNGHLKRKLIYACVFTRRDTDTAIDATADWTSSHCTHKELSTRMYFMYPFTNWLWEFLGNFMETHHFMLFFHWLCLPVTVDISPTLCLQYFDVVCWVTGRASGL